MSETALAKCPDCKVVMIDLGSTRYECPRCGGLYELCDCEDGKRAEMCGGCNGSGQGMYDGATCRACNGAGEFEYDCEDCLGMGWVEA
jgi:hypothetical protein